MEWKIKKRHSLKKSEIKKLKEYIKENLGEDLVLDGEYEKCELSNRWKIVLVDKIPSFLVLKDMIIPSLKIVMERNIKDFKNYVVIDMGAVPYIANGADVMAPGIVEIGEFEKNKFVFVGDEKNGKILSIGISLSGSKEISEKKEGKVIKTIHYVGDKFWNFEV
ncbi:RNA-binding protein [Thermococci archaeon]|nr:MAG: RNA-binding protein [Thermococci archaeon]